MSDQTGLNTVARKPAGLPTGLAVVLALLGFTAVVAQVVLMRELIVVFCGNELSLGLMLANWLLWTAVGSSLLGRLAARSGDARRCLAGLQLLIALAFPFTIFAVRLSKDYLQGTPGELLGPGSMFLTSLGTLSLFCMLAGCMFAVGSRTCAEAVGSTVAKASGSVYLLEAAGSCLGGITASAVLVPYLTAFDIAGLVAFLNILAAASLVITGGFRRRGVLLLMVAGMGLALAVFLSPRLEQDSLRRLWRGFRLVEVRNSRYGNLAVVETEGTRSLYENGLVVATVPNPQAAEEAAHFALLQHPAPRRLLMIGGGINGSLHQALQHPSLVSVDYVELDPAVVDLAESHFASEWLAAQADRRTRVHRLDGRLFLRTTETAYDVVVVNLPDPQTAQINRFFTREFYQEVAAKLTPEGILSFQVTASENYISPPLGEFLRCVNKTLRDVFPEVVAIPGDSVHFFAARRRGTLTDRAEPLLERMRARHLQTTFVREYILPFRMSADRMLELHQEIEPRPTTPVNRDFAPIAYYFDLALWSSRFYPGASQVFGRLSRIGFLPVLSGVLLVLAALTAVPFVVLGQQGADQRAEGESNRLRFVTGFCVAAMGFELIGLEILILLGFQAIYGYVYHQLAILIAAVMAGMALGAWLALCPNTRREAHGPQEPGARDVRKQLRNVCLLQLAAALSPVVLFGILQISTHIKSDFGLGLVSGFAFPFLALLIGLMGGYQFPVASQIYFAAKESSGPGALYGLDLLGAAAGAIVLSLYWFPVYGFLRSALLMAAVSLAPAIAAGVLAGWFVGPRRQRD